MTTHDTTHIPEGWSETTLGEVAIINVGFVGKVSESISNKEDGISMITTKNIRGGNIDLSDVYFVDKEFHEKNKKSSLKKGDIVVARHGDEDNGKAAMLNKDIELNCMNVIVVRPIQEMINGNFVLQFMASKNYLAQVQGLAGGSVQKVINTKQLGEIKILLPPFPEQQSIADMLSSFDSKIELLREQNETLEKTAQTIFHEWFGRYSVESLEELPEGWRVGKLGEAIENFDSQRIPIASDKREKGEFPYYGATGINDYVSDYIFDGIYTLLGEDGSVIKENGKPFTQYVWGKTWVNNHAHVLQGKNGFSTELVKIILDRTDIAPFVNGAVQLKINQTNMNSIPVIIPTNDCLQEFDKLIQPIFEKLRSNSEQIQSLSKTRDTLLPKLMSGEVRVV